MMSFEPEVTNRDNGLPAIPRFYRGTFDSVKRERFLQKKEDLLRNPDDIARVLATMLLQVSEPADGIGLAGKVVSYSKFVQLTTSRPDFPPLLK